MRFTNKETFRIIGESLYYRVPRVGVIGYTTNSPEALKNFMSVPKSEFNFQFLDLGAEDKTMQQKIDQTGESLLKQINVDLLAAEERQRILCQYNGDGAVFVKNFPKNVQEAILHEQLTGGLNLFVNFEFNQVPWFMNERLENLIADQSEEKIPKDNTVVPVKSSQEKSKELSELLGFYEKRGVLVTFTYDIKKQLDQNMSEFLKNVIEKFKF